MLYLTVRVACPHRCLGWEADRQAHRQTGRQAGKQASRSVQTATSASSSSFGPVPPLLAAAPAGQQHIQSIIHAHVPTVVPFSPLRCLIVLVFLNAEGLFQYTALDRFPPIHLTSSINGTKHITQRSPQKNVSTLCNLHSLPLSLSPPSISPQPSMV